MSARGHWNKRFAKNWASLRRQGLSARNLEARMKSIIQNPPNIMNSKYFPIIWHDGLILLHISKSSANMVDKSRHLFHWRWTGMLGEHWGEHLFITGDLGWVVYNPEIHGRSYKEIQNFLFLVVYYYLKLKARGPCEHYFFSNLRKMILCLLLKMCCHERLPLRQNSRDSTRPDLSWFDKK